MSATASPSSVESPALRLKVEEYIAFRRDGYLILRGLLSAEEVRELHEHTDALLEGRDTLDGYIDAPELAERMKQLLRVHQGHQRHELWERYLLHPRILDVVQALQGPDVLALQTMLFTKAPGSNGQGFHQDSFFIPSFPDSLIGAWIAIERADEANGCLWISPGSQDEPVYPPANGRGFGQSDLADITEVANVGGHSNDDDDALNTLKPIASRYIEGEIPVVLEPGDVVFFGGHVFHRSLSNKTEDRYRRSLVNHYCNARSYLTWGGGNAAHILARGNSHLGFAQPKFGTPCAANDPARASVSDVGAAMSMMMGMPDGRMDVRPAPDVSDEP